MDDSHKRYTIKKGELLLLFLLFVIGGGLIFAVGVRIGKNILQNDCQAIIEDNQKRIEELEAKKTASIEEEAEPVEPVKEDEPEPEKIIISTTKTKKVEKQPKPTVNNKDELGIKEITNEIRGKYTIQISSYQDEEEAQREANALYSDGYKLAYYMEAEVPNKGIWYRVGVGFFEKKTSAQMFADMLKKQGKITSYLIRRVD